MGKHGEGTLYKKRGRGCWRVKWMFEGKLHDESTGTEDIEKARKIARQPDRQRKRTATKPSFFVVLCQENWFNYTSDFSGFHSGGES